MKLKLENVEFSYPGVSVLENINFELKKGEILAITGKNGAGKSTLLKCISKVLETYSGIISIDKIDTQILSRRDLAKQVAYLSQKIPETFTLTVFDTVLMGRYPHSGKYISDENKKDVAEILKLADLQDVAFRDFNTLSGGQQQKVLIARALAQNPKILLFDEPTSALDIKHQLQIMELIQKLVKENGISAVVSMHDLNLASRYADRIVMLNDGIVSAAGTPADVFSAENIANAYDVHVEVRKEKDYHFIIPIKPIEG